MSMRVHFAIDPGLTGAIGVFKDGEPALVVDMPTKQVGKSREVDAHFVAELVRTVRAMHTGASFTACLEHVGSMPTDGRTSAFRFGEGFGKIKATLEVLGIPYELVIPAVWKRRMGLIGTEKDAARVLAIKRFPSMAGQLKLKKHGGRADALLIGLYHEHEQYG